KGNKFAKVGVEQQSLAVTEFVFRSQYIVVPPLSLSFSPGTRRLVVSYVFTGCGSGLLATLNGICVSSLMARLLILKEHHDFGVTFL
ncbi:MAG: hypothetical protein NTW63_02185, partial [Caldiserica bacterium]|nr:hypothetical protein [Caldisericota bacterium]